MSRPVLIPDHTHPITIEPTGKHVVVRTGNKVIADTINALTLDEHGYNPAVYIPLADVERTVLVSSATKTYCPYKGEASYSAKPSSSVSISSTPLTPTDRSSPSSSSPRRCIPTRRI